ncbi:DUF4214 domain-containing protein [Methylobacterium sp. E-016]|uniref:DUF4214 domain-containing protein n=1 Tax=Methylobacterium sp. E-016 TaxID=2836556 RepID=UPI001FB8E2D9|nr:DUF4214 domain-containing protein [Methylobacterium sp. E-016]MCJ2074769.1 DUF4214 domain-containing protein [Methylobacterium sp. E-016]
MSDLSNNNSAGSATYKGVLLPYGWTTSAASRSANFLIYDSVGDGTSDPVDFYKITTPEGVSQISLTMSTTLIGSNDIVSYYASIDGTKLSGLNGGVQATSQYTAAFQQQGVLTPNGYTAVWAVTPGDHYIEVHTGAYSPSGQPIEHNYSLEIDLQSYLSTQPGLSTNTPGNTNTNTTPTNNPNQTYTSSDGVTHVPAQGGHLAYTYTSGDQVYNNIVVSADGHTTTSILPHVISGGGASSEYTLFNLGGGSIGFAAKGASAPAFIYKNFEGIQFTDKIVFFLDADHSNVARLYSAALGRAPDAAGLANWENNFDAYVPAAAKANYYTALSDTILPVSGMSIAAGFTNSQEFKNKYGSLNDTQYVTQLYVNVLGRGPETAGLNNWLNNMHDGPHLSREAVLVGLAESTENIAKAAHDWLITF